jgi:ABC-2 type transport system ATP-binding protein
MPDRDRATDCILDIQALTKTYASGPAALAGIDLQIRRGELFALLGPNGAGKTTLIGIVCGLVNASSGSVRVDGFDIRRDFRRTRAMIGLVPQELHTDMFETVGDTVRFSRGLFGLAPDPGHIERTLRDLTLWDKRDAKIMTLSGGMKRRVLIAKALAHEPKLLFLDEPSAGVDVELRREMWSLIRRLRETGVTIVLTTHYIEEAEQMADRVGVILKGRLLLVDETAALLTRLGRKQLSLHLETPLSAIPDALAGWPLTLSEDGRHLHYRFDSSDEQRRVPALIRRLAELGLEFSDLNTRQSSLEDIFVDLVRETP